MGHSSRNPASHHPAFWWADSALWNAIRFQILYGKHDAECGTASFLVRLSTYQPESEPRKLGGYEKQIRVAEDFGEEDPRVLRFYRTL